MRNFIAFVNAVLIVSSVFSYVCCLPTQTPPETLDEGSTTSKEHSTCFDAPEDISDDDRANKHAFAVDSEGKLCFVRLNSGRYAISENEDEIEARYANVTREFCPLWPGSKKCLLDHLNGDRCSEDDKKVLQLSSLNEELLFSELFCNPLRKTSFFNTMKSMKKEKLWDCFELESVKAVLNDCFTKRSGHRSSPALNVLNYHR